MAMLDDKPYSPHRQIHQYEILFKNPEGRIASVVNVIALDDNEAKSIALQMRASQSSTAYVMHSGKLVAALYPPILY
jgi:LPS sulfotransferase NodH